MDIDTTTFEEDIAYIKSDCFYPYKFTTILEKNFTKQNFNHFYELLNVQELNNIQYHYYDFVTVISDFNMRDNFEQIGSVKITKFIKKLVEKYKKYISHNIIHLFTEINYNSILCRTNILYFLITFKRYISPILPRLDSTRPVSLHEDICKYGSLTVLKFLFNNNYDKDSGIIKECLVYSYQNTKDARIFEYSIKLINSRDIYIEKELFMFICDAFKKRYPTNLKKIKLLLTHFPKYKNKICQNLLNTNLNIICFNYLLYEIDFEITDTIDSIGYSNLNKLKTAEIMRVYLSKFRSTIVDSQKLKIIRYMFLKNRLILTPQIIEFIETFFDSGLKIHMANSMLYEFINSNEIVLDNSYITEFLNYIFQLNNYEQKFEIKCSDYILKDTIIESLFYNGFDLIQIFKNSHYFNNNTFLKYYNCQRILKRKLKLFQQTTVKSHRNILSKSFDKLIHNNNNYYCSISRNLPQHFTRELFMKLLNSNTIHITPKADGIYSTINLSVCYPFINLFNIRKTVFEAEQITYKGKTIHMVFGNFKYQYKLIEAHPYTNSHYLYEASSISDIEKIIKMENVNFDAFVTSNINRNETDTLWYPKIIVKLNNHLDFDYETLMKLETTTYSIDGWVFYNAENDIYKLKNPKHMTIDLLYDRKKLYMNSRELFTPYHTGLDGLNNGVIYRCYFENGEWIPREPRFDKKTPNNKEIVQNVLNYTQNPWNYNELCVYYKNNFLDRNNFYYANQTPTIKSCSFTHHIPKHSNILEKYLQHSDNVVDIACGFRSNYFKKKYNITNYLGFDANINTSQKYINLNSNWCESNDQLYSAPLCKANVLMCINAIHYLTNPEQFSFNIDSISSPNSIFIISYLDWDLVEKVLGTNTAFFRENYVKVIGERRIKYYYSHCHNRPVTENVFSLNDIKHMISSKWNMVEISDEPNKDDLWQSYLNCFRVAVFEKI